MYAMLLAPATKLGQFFARQRKEPLDLIASPANCKQVNTAPLGGISSICGTVLWVVCN